MPLNLNSLEKQSKKISFVVPIYKTEKYLKKSLESLLDMSYKNIEIICVADGKSEKASEIVSTLKNKDKRIVRYLTIPHGGAPRARNEGFKWTKGDYVSFWDSDCYAEPEMARMWVKAFLLHPEHDFVYSGYRFNDPNVTPMHSRPFNAYALTTDNYIATMFPMKRKIFPGFDETLKSLQDWDMWLTITEKGSTGFWLDGMGFTTEARRGISSVGCLNENWLERYKIVREKHGIKDRDLCFSTQSNTIRATELAQMFNADVRNMPSHKPHEYKKIYQIGFYAQQMETTSKVFDNAPNCKKYLHFIGEDIESIYNLPFKTIEPLVKSLNLAVNRFLCEDIIAQQMLEKIGINADILPLPTKYVKLPKSRVFRVFYEFDTKPYQELFESLQKALPMLKIESPANCNMKDYGCFVSITESQFPSENMKKFIAAGREAITNYRLPFAGTVEVDKDKIISAIFDAKQRWMIGSRTPESVEYYKNLINPENFKKEIILK